MNFLKTFFDNHVLANLVFVLVLIIGTWSFLQLPREQDPEINFNWIDITTIAPGMAAADVEKRVTDVLEDAIYNVSDTKFVSSNSRESISNILVRFEDMPGAQFDKRVIDLRREIQNKESELPDEVESPFIFEITTANAFPTATLVVTAPDDDENLRWQAERVKKELERIDGVDRILTTALHTPELQVNFNPQRLNALGISPNTLADTVALFYRDVSAGSTEVGAREYSIRFTGTNPDPDFLAAIPLIGQSSEIRLADIAEIKRGREKPRHLVYFNEQPGVMFAITKKAGANTLDLVDRLNAYVINRDSLATGTGVRVHLVDDRTEITRNALNIMQTNALLGLGLVLLTAWLFLGIWIALLTAIGIPFILAGTFWLLQIMGQTLNVTVLLGVVISLGMLVDDAVVVVEGIYYRLQRGITGMKASLGALQEVAAPVTAAVLTTIAAFLPLMLLPGILGKFMMVIPLVVTTALAISLVEAFWMLPVHVSLIRTNFKNPSRIQAWRMRFLQGIRIKYTRLLIRAMRHPILIISTLLLLFFMAVFGAFAGQVQPQLYKNPLIKPFLVKTDFFASDPLRLYYINIEMPNGTPLHETMEKVLEVEKLARGDFRPGEVRNIVSYAGQMFTEMAPFIGPQYGQILVTLNPETPDLRSVDRMMDDLRPKFSQITGTQKLFFLRLAGGPPVSRPISVKVRGDDLSELRSAVSELKDILSNSGFSSEISDDDSPGLQEMVLQVDADASRRSGIRPDEVQRAIRLMVNGEVVSSMQDRGEKLVVRIQSDKQALQGLEDILHIHLPTADGTPVALSSLVTRQHQTGIGNIRHYNFRRTITVEAEINKALTDTRQANAYIVERWQKIHQKYPGIDLDFSGELDDINESIGAIGKLMLFGVLLMYAILGTQFRSYFQPMMILITVPMAFTGVVIGLIVTQNPLSLYTLYGVVALAGIAVNAAIVLISAANQRLKNQMSVLHATLYAARRRVIPILITSLTTVAGLFSLATGLGGKSLLWGPIATAIVWGLVVSTILTLFVVPILYRQFMRFSYLNPRRQQKTT